MSWTPENDRLLLLKLVETSGISVNAEAIVKAWRKYSPGKYKMRRKRRMRAGLHAVLYAKAPLGELRFITRARRLVFSTRLVHQYGSPS
jgi:hypothetical protein